MGKDSESTIIVYIYKTITASLQINPVSFMYIVHKINYCFFIPRRRLGFPIMQKVFCIVNTELLINATLEYLLNTALLHVSLSINSIQKISDLL